MKEQQELVGNWQREAYSQELLTPEHRLARASMEWDELILEVEQSGNMEAMAEEAVDVIITLLGFIDTTGFDAQDLVNKKIELMYEKYNPEQLALFKEQGMSELEAIAEAKRLWEIAC